MNTHADKTQENKSQAVSVVDSQIQSGGESTLQFVDNRPEAVAQRKLQEMANNSQQVSQLRAFQKMANNSPQAKQAAQLQAIADNYSTKRQQPIQKKENNTGLPDNLKAGIENLSGYSMDDVKVHYNSDKPAQLKAHAYAQGTDIHVESGQEKHLPHEAWHVAQQKQGRVQATTQLRSAVPINDDSSLEKEADVMGDKAVKVGSSLSSEEKPTQLKSFASQIVQRNEDEEDSEDSTTDTTGAKEETSGKKAAKKPADERDEKAWKAVADLEKEVIAKPVSADDIIGSSRWATSWAAGLGWKALFTTLHPWLNGKITEKTGIQPQTSPSFYQALNGLTVYYENLHGPMNWSEGGVNATAADFSIKGLTAELGVNSFREFWNQMKNFQNLKLKVNVDSVEAKKIRIQSPTMDVTLDLRITNVGLKGRGGMTYTILQILSKALPYYGEKRSIKDIIVDGLQGSVSIGNIQIDIHNDSWINTDADKEENTFKPADTKGKKKPSKAELAKEEAEFREKRQAINKAGAVSLHKGHIEVDDFLAAGVVSDKTGKQVARTSVGGIRATGLDVGKGDKGATVGNLSVGHSSATLENDHVNAAIGDVEASEILAKDVSDGLTEDKAVQIEKATMGRSHLDADIGGKAKKVNAGLGTINISKVEAGIGKDLEAEARNIEIAPSSLEANIVGKDASVVADIGAASMAGLAVKKGERSVNLSDTVVAPSHVEATSKSKTLKNGKAFTDKVPKKAGSDTYTTDQDMAVEASLGDVSIGEIMALNTDDPKEHVTLNKVGIKGVGAKANVSKSTELATDEESGLTKSTSLLDSTKASVGVDSVTSKDISAQAGGKKAALKKLELAKIAASHTSTKAKGKTTDETSTVGLGKATLSELSYNDPNTALKVGAANLGGVKAGKGSKGLSLETDGAKVSDVHLRHHKRSVIEETIHDDRSTLSSERNVTAERQDLLKKLDGTHTKTATVNVGSAEVGMTGAGHHASDKAIGVDSMGASVKGVNITSVDNSPGVDKIKRRAIRLGQVDLAKAKAISHEYPSKNEFELGLQISDGSVASRPGAQAFIDIDKVGFYIGTDGSGKIGIDLTFHDKGKEAFTGTPVGIKDDDPVHFNIPVKDGIIAFDDVKPQLEKTGLRSFFINHFLNIRVTDEHVEHHLLKRKTVTKTPPRLKASVLGINVDKTYLKDLGITEEQQAEDPVLLARQLKQVGEKGGINLISFLKHTVQAQVRELQEKLAKSGTSSEAFMLDAAMKGLAIKRHEDLAEEREKVVDKTVTRENRKGESGPQTVEKVTTASDALTEVNLKEAEIGRLGVSIDGGLSLSDLMPEISSPDTAGLSAGLIGEAFKGSSGSKGASSSGKKRTLEEARHNDIRGAMADPTGRQYTRIDRGIVDQDSRGNSCGFLTLNTTREALRDSLIQSIQAPADGQLQAMLNFIGDEIQNTIIRQGHLEFDDHNIQTLQQAYATYNIREQARADLIRDVRAFRGDGAPQMNLDDCAHYLTSPAVTGGLRQAEGAELYARFLQVTQQFAAARALLDQTFRDPQLAFDYLRNNLNGGQMLGTGTARAWAIANDVELHVWTHVNEDDPTSSAIVEISPGDVAAGARRVDMLHTWNRRHFQELLRH